MATLFESIAAAERDRDEWLESVLAALRAAGTPKDDIRVQVHPDMITLVTVRGEPAHRHEMKIDWDLPREEGRQRD